MHYVYLLRSIPHPEQTYVEHTENLKARVQTHNHGQSPHTSKFKPFNLITFIAFSDKDRALSFEKYLKSHSGKAFANIMVVKKTFRYANVILLQPFMPPFLISEHK